MTNEVTHGAARPPQPKLSEGSLRPQGRDHLGVRGRRRRRTGANQRRELSAKARPVTSVQLLGATLDERRHRNSGLLAGRKEETRERKKEEPSGLVLSRGH